MDTNLTLTYLMKKTAKKIEKLKEQIGQLNDQLKREEAKLEGFRELESLKELESLDTLLDTLFEDTEKRTSSGVAKIAKKVFLQHPTKWFGSAQLANKAVEMGLWEKYPATYQSVMSGTLKRLVGKVDWLQTKQGVGRNMLYKFGIDLVKINKIDT